jgi:hypothetical protein
VQPLTFHQPTCESPIFYPNDVPDLPKTGYKLLKKVLPQIEPDILVDNGQPYEFTQGGVEFVVYPTPGAEGSDGVSVSTRTIIRRYLLPELRLFIRI